MNILNTVLNNEFSLKYYGLGDIATNWHVGMLLEKNSEIINYLEQMTSEILSDDDFHDYLFISTLLKYQEVVSNLKNDSDKEILNSLIQCAIHTQNRYTRDLEQIYQLINRDYLSLLKKDTEDYNRHDFVDHVLVYIFKQHSRIEKKVFDYVEENYWGYILNEFETCINYYKGNIARIDLLLTKVYEFEKGKPYTNIDKFLINYKILPFVDIFTKHAIILADKAIALIKTINEDNYIEIYSFYEDIVKVAKKYNLIKQQNDLDASFIQIDQLKNSYFNKHGKVFKYEIPVKEMLDKLRYYLIEQALPTNIILLTLTHKKEKEKMKYVASINSAFEEPKSVFIDLVRHIGLGTNAQFTPSVQSNLRLIFGLQDSFLGALIQDNQLSAVLFDVLIKVLELICKKHNLDYEDLSTELNGIIDSIVYLGSIDETYPYYRTYCFGLSQTICSYIEKLLRKILVEEYDKEVIYLPEYYITLKDILDNQVIKDILGNELTSIIVFELHQITEYENGIQKKIGLNMRNRLMHNNDINFMTDINSALVVHLFDILIIIIHQLETNLIQIID